MFRFAAAFCVLTLNGCGSEHQLVGLRDGDDTALPRPDDTVPPKAVCGASPPVVAPGEPARFVGENSHDPDGIPLTRYRWTLQQAPDLSRATLPAGQENVDGFVPDVTGDYLATLVVVNDRGNPSNACTARLQAIPTDDLWLELSWARPADNIDLVLLRNGAAILTEEGHPAAPDLCRPGFCDVDWGTKGDPQDDPELVLLDTDGTGPEIMALPTAADAFYDIGVYDNPSHTSYGDNRAQVRIVAGGEVVFDGAYTLMGEPGGPSDGDPENLPVFLARVQFMANGAIQVRPCKNPGPGVACEL